MLNIALEGSDGVGKTTIARILHAQFKKIAELHYRQPIETVLAGHPGSTPLGKHIRKLLKETNDIDREIVIDPLSRQLLYYIDAINFSAQILQPALDAKKFVFNDRSTYISSMVYGLADGLQLSEIENILRLHTPPRIDRLYILRCDPKIAAERVRNSRISSDYFDNKPPDFFAKIHKCYDTLVTGPTNRTLLVNKVVGIDDIVYINADDVLETVISNILIDLLHVVDDRKILVAP